MINLQSYGNYAQLDFPSESASHVAADILSEYASTIKGLQKCGITTETRTSLFGNKYLIQYDTAFDSCEGRDTFKNYLQSAEFDTKVKYEAEAKRIKMSMEKLLTKPDADKKPTTWKGRLKWFVEKFYWSLLFWGLAYTPFCFLLGFAGVKIWFAIPCYFLFCFGNAIGCAEGRDKMRQEMSNTKED